MTRSFEDTARDFALASMLAAYPDRELETTAETLRGALVDHAAAAPMFAFLDAEGGYDALRSRYVDLFDRGKGRTSLYETEYGRMRGMSKGNDLADIAGFYHAFGLDLDTDAAHEMLDHVAVELEFYAMLLAKQRFLTEQRNDEGCEIVEDARRKFLAEHLGSFVHAIADRPDVREDPAYGPIFAWCSLLIRGECEALGVTPAPLDFFADVELDRDMKCASLPVVQ